MLISYEDLKFVPHFWKLRTQPCEEKCRILGIFLGFNANFSLEDYTEYHWMNYSSSEKPILSLVYAKSLKICCKERVIKDERNKQKLNVKEMLNWLQLDNTCLWQNECFWWRPCTKSSPKISEYFVNTHSQRCYFFFPLPQFSPTLYGHFLMGVLFYPLLTCQGSLTLFIFLLWMLQLPSIPGRRCAKIMPPSWSKRDSTTKRPLTC